MITRTGASIFAAHAEAVQPALSEALASAAAGAYRARAQDVMSHNYLATPFALLLTRNRCRRWGSRGSELQVPALTLNTTHAHNGRTHVLSSFVEKSFGEKQEVLTRRQEPAPEHDHVTYCSLPGDLA